MGQNFAEVNGVPQPDSPVSAARAFRTESLLLPSSRQTRNGRWSVFVRFLNAQLPSTERIPIPIEVFVDWLDLIKGD